MAEVYVKGLRIILYNMSMLTSCIIKNTIADMKIGRSPGPGTLSVRRIDDEEI